MDIVQTLKDALESRKEPRPSSMPPEPTLSNEASGEIKRELKGEAISLKDKAIEIAKAHGLPPLSIYAIAATETGGERDPINAQSSKDAQGLMQQREIFRKEYKISNSKDPVEAMEGTARALKDLISRFGTIEGALAAYNAGPGTVRKKGMAALPQETKLYVENAVKIIEGQPPVRLTGRHFNALMDQPISNWRVEKK